MVSGHPERSRNPLGAPVANERPSSGSIGLAVYDDRLEVTSTGPLHFGLTPDDQFSPHESRPWNPLIARTFYRRGIIEEWGRGTIKMAELATSGGLPRLEIEERGDCVTVRFRHPDFIAPRPNGNDLIERQQAILAMLERSEGGLPLRAIHARLPLQISERQVRRALAKGQRINNLVGLTANLP